MSSPFVTAAFVRHILLLYMTVLSVKFFAVNASPNFGIVTYGTCRCFGSDRTPGVAPRGVFRSRTVSTTVAKWFVSIARRAVDKIYRFGPLRDA
jgi:hypothetical protein